MAIGDDATAAGMPLVPGSLPANQLDTEDNRSRDFIAQGHANWKAGVVLPLTKGGTGATSAAAARTALGVAPTAGANAATPGSTPEYNSSGRLVSNDPATAFDVATKQYVDAATGGGSYLPLAGGTVTGQLYLPNSFGASSGYTVGYINSDGRVCRGVSAAKYKKNISEIGPDSLGDIFPDFHRWQMRADGIVPADPTWRYGYIADRLAEHPDQAPFVVVIDGEVESIDFIGLLLAQVAQLNERLKVLEAGP